MLLWPSVSLGSLPQMPCRHHRPRDQRNPERAEECFEEVSRLCRSPQPVRSPFSRSFSPTVKRIVYTTSTATMVKPTTVPLVFDESNWNEYAIEETMKQGRNASGWLKYFASKTLAEKGTLQNHRLPYCLHRSCLLRRSIVRVPRHTQRHCRLGRRLHRTSLRLRPSAPGSTLAEGN